MVECVNEFMQKLVRAVPESGKNFQKIEILELEEPFCEMAGRPMSGFALDKFRIFLETNFFSDRAASIEITTRRGICGARDIAFQDDANTFFDDVRVGYWNGCH